MAVSAVSVAYVFLVASIVFFVYGICVAYVVYVDYVVSFFCVLLSVFFVSDVRCCLMAFVWRTLFMLILFFSFLIVLLSLLFVSDVCCCLR